MERKEIQIPKGCKKITIDIEDGNVVVSYHSTINSREFMCQETGEIEERPGVGDFCIFWEKTKRDNACCANYTGKNGVLHISSDGFGYDHAIKFRNYEQFLKVRGKYAEDEP